MRRGTALEITTEEQTRIKVLYTSGKTISEISREIDRSHKFIRKWLFTDILKIKRKKYNNLSVDIEQEILELYKNKHIFLFEIAKKYNISIAILRRFLSLNNLSRSVYRKYSINEEYFDDMNSSNKAYVLGLLYADGCLHKNQNLVRLALQASDLTLLEIISKEMGNTRPLFYGKPNVIKDTNYTSSGYYSLDIQSLKLRKSLELLGLHPNKSIDLEFPINLCDSLIFHFIRGYFDGDGNISNPQKSRQCVASLLGTFNFLSVIKKLLEKEEVICTLSYIKKTKCTYSLTLTGKENIKKFGELLYENADLYLDRKQEKFNKWKNPPYDTRKNKSKVNS